MALVGQSGPARSGFVMKSAYSGVVKPFAQTKLPFRSVVFNGMKSVRAKAGKGFVSFGQMLVVVKMTFQRNAQPTVMRFTVAQPECFIKANNAFVRFWIDAGAFGKTSFQLAAAEAGFFCQLIYRNQTILLQQPAAGSVYR